MLFKGENNEEEQDAELDPDFVDIKDQELATS